VSPKQKKPKDPTAISEVQRRRAITNYNKPRISGFAAIPMAAGPDGRRITSPSGWCILSTILEECFGRRVEKDEPFKEETLPIGMAKLAELAMIEPRTAQRELKYMRKHKIIQVQESKKGLYVIQPLVRDWASLPDYKPEPMEESTPNEPDEPKTDSEDKAKDKTVTQVTSKPVRVAPGKPSKPVKVECGVTALQFAADIDAEYSAVVQGGTLLVSLKRWQAKDGITISKETRSSEINNLVSNSRHPHRTNGTDEKRTEGEKRIEGEQVTGGQSSPGGRGSQSRQGIPPVQKQARQPQPDITSYHPRSKELADLFDPFLLKSCGKSLSGDHTALLAACEAIQDTDHDFVVKCVVDRAARPISGPRAAVAICKEIAHNWKKAKDLPAAKKLPTREEYLAIAAKERAERLGKKGRVA
jgi:hypothetical protein